MAASVSISLGLVEAIPPSLAFLIVGRDVLLIGGGFLHRARTRNPEDSFFNVNSLNWQVKKLGGEHIVVGSCCCCDI